MTPRLLPISPNGRRYGAQPSKLDPRDYSFARFAAFAEIEQVKIPPSVSLQGDCGPVRDQGDEGSCTGHAGYAMRMHLRNALQNADKKNQVTFSPASIYWHARLIDGTTDQDAGSTGRSVCIAMNKYGAAPIGDEPYVAGDYATPPSAKAEQDALKWKAGAYHRLLSVDEMKHCIASGYGFIVGFAVYESFEADNVARSGIMPVPNVNRERCLGGHEVFFMGYDDAKAAFTVQNSWGTAWGQDGFFQFPYECAKDENVLFDAFIQHLGKPW